MSLAATASITMSAIWTKMATLDLAAKTDGGKSKKCHRTPAKSKESAQKLLSELAIEELWSGLSKLPQELHDQIKKHVFTPAPGMRRLSKNYRESFRKDINCLHVSRDTRASYAELYYGNGNTFCFDGRYVPYFHGLQYDTGRTRSWLKVLPEAHRALLHKVVMEKILSSDPGEKVECERMVAIDFWREKHHCSLALWNKKVLYEHVGGELHERHGWKVVDDVSGIWRDRARFVDAQHAFLDRVPSIFE